MKLFILIIQTLCIIVGSISIFSGVLDIIQKFLLYDGKDLEMTDWVILSFCIGVFYFLHNL